jgi:hypothetical protein
MSVRKWFYLSRLEWPDCKVVSYTDDNGVTTKTFMSDLLLCGDGKRVVTGHLIDGMFCCELAPETVIKWKPVPGWLLPKISGGRFDGKWYKEITN